MGLFNKIRQKSKHATKESTAKHGNGPSSFSIKAALDPRSLNQQDLTATIPTSLLERIFTFVCPHSQDETYQNCEDAAPDYGCCLCDARDLAHCARVSRRWNKLASNILYNSIRIDQVHYCPREAMLAEQRKHRSFFDRNAEPEDAGSARLRLLTRTLRSDNAQLAQKVRYFKVPYMLRETNICELAKAVAVMPRLQYVDLPEHFYADHASCKILRNELFARCPDIKKMSYHAGSEHALAILARQNNWSKLEVLEIEKLWIDPMLVRHAIAALPHLKALKIAGVENIDDTFFQEASDIPPFPALEELIIDDMPNITVTGLLYYLRDHVVQSNLSVLSLTKTGVLPSDLHQLLHTAPKLVKLAMIETVQGPFTSSTAGGMQSPNTLRPGSNNTPPLQSRSLEILNYEILDDTATHQRGPRQSIKSSYYNYLSTSLLAGGLPALHTLYVRDVDFPESLIDFAIAPPIYHNNSGNRLSSNNPFNSANLQPKSRSRLAPSAPARPFNRELQVFTKGSEDMTWDFSKIEDALPVTPQVEGSGHARSPSNASHLSSNRPMSSYGLAIGENTGGWQGASPSTWSTPFRGAGVRSSVIVTNGAGSFLPLPTADLGIRPNTSGGSTGQAPSDWPSFPKEEKRSSRIDMWR